MKNANNMDQQHEGKSDKEVAANLRATLAEAQAQRVIDFGAVAKLAGELDKVMKRITKAERSASNDDEMTQEAYDISHEEVKKRFRAELKRRDYHYVTANEKFWLRAAGNEWMPVSEKGLMRDITDASSLILRNTLFEVMKEDGRWYDRCTYTFDKTDSRTLNMLVRDFADVEEGEAHWFFDLLIRSIGGSREENYRHIEQLILSKFLHPESVTIPALLLQDGGGTGKSLLASRLLPAIFGEHGVASNLRVEHVTSKFNSIGQGKAIWFLNEASRGGYSHASLKALVGSETYAIEHKGVNPILSPMTAWIVMATQDADGAVLLEGNEADRRWSVVRGDRPLADLVADHLGCDRAGAKAWIDGTGKHILSDRNETGRWLRSLVERHGDVCVSQGLHAADYRAVVDIQRPVERLVCDAVFGDPEFEMIRTTVLYDIYAHYARAGNRMPIGRGKFHAQVSNYLRDYHPEMVGKLATNLETQEAGKTIKRAKIEIYTAAPVSGPLYYDRSDRYIRQDEYGRGSFTVEI